MLGSATGRAPLTDVGRSTPMPRSSSYETPSSRSRNWQKADLYRPRSSGLTGREPDGCLRRPLVIAAPWAVPLGMRGRDRATKAAWREAKTRPSAVFATGRQGMWRGSRRPRAKAGVGKPARGNSTRWERTRLTETRPGKPLAAPAARASGAWKSVSGTAATLRYRAGMGLKGATAGAR